MTYILHGDTGSGSATVELALAEIGLPVVTRDYDLGHSKQRGSDYAALNPQQKLPTLEFDDGSGGQWVMTESAAILLTLADRHPGAALLPTDPVQRDHALRWLLFMATELYPVIEIVDYPERFQPEGERTPPARRKALQDHARGIWQRRWLLVEREASDSAWFLGEAFSLLDIYAAVLSRWGQMDDWRPRNLPRIDAIAGGISVRPSTASVWRRHFG